MPRQRDPHRLRDLIQAASRIFLEKGYRQAQVADVARHMGIAPGTVYLYAESKEALFDLAIRASLTPELLDSPLALPVRTPPPGSTLQFIREALQAEAVFPALDRALQSPGPSPPRELEEITRELFARTSARWQALKLMERCALDWPELAQLWFGDHRLRLLRGLSRYLRERMAEGRLRPAPDPDAAARLILEMVAAFALHCRTEPPPAALDLGIAEETVVDAVVNAYRPRRG
jgi:AcrR family transcriptional regulator